jgi:hypothetical protein
MNHTHDHTDDIARSIFNKIERIMSFKPSHAENLFVQQDVATTRVFWLLLESESPNHYEGVDYCPACKKFTLFPRKT